MTSNVFNPFITYCFKILHPDWEISTYSATPNGEEASVVLVPSSYRTRSQVGDPSLPVHLRFGTKDDMIDRVLLNASFIAGPRDEVGADIFHISNARTALHLGGPYESLAKPGLESVKWFRRPGANNPPLLGVLSYPRVFQPKMAFFGDELSIRNFTLMGPGGVPSVFLNPSSVTEGGLTYLLPAERTFPGRRVGLLIPEQGALHLAVTDIGKNSLQLVPNSMGPQEPSDWSSFYGNKNDIYAKPSPRDLHDLKPNEGVVLSREASLVAEGGRPFYKISITRVARFLGGLFLCIGVWQALEYFKEGNYKKAGLELAIAGTQNSSPCLSSALEYCKAYV